MGVIVGETRDEKEWGVLESELRKKLLKRGFTAKQISRMDFERSTTRRGKKMVSVKWKIGHVTTDHCGNAIFSLPDTGSDR